MLPRKKILIADTQSFFSAGIVQYLKEADWIDIIAVINSENQLWDAINKHYPDVVILDIGLISGDAPLTIRLKQFLPSMAVIILTSEFSDQELVTAIVSRASAYIDRNILPADLINVIRRSANGEYPLNDTFLDHPEVAQQVLVKFQDLSWGRGIETYITPLTPRETEILTQMAKGHANKQIAEILYVSEHTIKNHITSIMRKLDVNARTEAVIIAIKRGIISL
jgi:DNA-binding NarL/FixJ family response regulator